MMVDLIISRRGSQRQRFGTQLPNQTCGAAIALDAFPSLHQAELAVASTSPGPSVSFCTPGRSAWYRYDGEPEESRLA